ncbi:rCG43654 [Rattus norvegicus]|uniref:RCG43654 n=1 Tax=Rattus norvegicus TaxID=10116 RepID=A6JJ44_RAT|nr:rCG43654 [Rattus norvegicus]
MYFFNFTFWDRRKDHWLSLRTLWTHRNPEAVLSFRQLITPSLGSVFENWPGSELG